MVTFRQPSASISLMASRTFGIDLYRILRLAGEWVGCVVEHVNREGLLIRTPGGLRLAHARTRRPQASAVSECVKPSTIRYPHRLLHGYRPGTEVNWRRYAMTASTLHEAAGADPADLNQSSGPRSPPGTAGTPSAAGPIVPLHSALLFPGPLPDHVQTPLNTSAICR